MPPRISFCIPTANRSDDLDRCLWSIYAEAMHEQALDRIEVCIADNASTDPTPERCAQWAARFPHLRIFRQDARRDFFTNLLASTALATGDHIWLFGDDDSVVPGTLGTLLAALASAPRFLHVAAMTFSRAGGGGGVIGVNGPIEAPVTPLFAGELPQPAWGYISCLIFERKAWVDSPRHAERHPVEVTAHVQVVADCLAAGHCLALHVPGALIDKTPQRIAAWNGSWTVMYGYEFLKARQHRFAPHPSGARHVQYPRRSFVQCFAVLSLLREHYDGLYEKAASLRPPIFFDAVVQRCFGLLFASPAVRRASVALLDRCSAKFRSRMAILGGMEKNQTRSSP